MTPNFRKAEAHMRQMMNKFLNRIKWTTAQAIHIGIWVVGIENRPRTHSYMILTRK